jgi:hypothetical protein
MMISDEQFHVETEVANHPDVSFNDLSILANGCCTTQENETRNLSRMGEDVGELGVFGRVYFLNTRHGGKNTRRI